MRAKIAKRATTIGRLTRYATQPRLYPRSPAPFSFWWHLDSNFGDKLTPMLLPHYGIAPVLRGPSIAQLFGVGSLINGVPNGYDGWIWGTGSFGYEDRDLSTARVAALRGPLTRDLLGVRGDVALGDPGLLVSRVSRTRARQKRWRLGVVPHKVHRSHEVITAWRRHFGGEVTFIDVTRRPESVIAEIKQCKSIVSTSLHGMIVADSFGIPAAWGTLSPIEGGDFKFRDHDTAVGAPRRRIDPQATDSPEKLILATKSAPSDIVETRIQGIEKATEAMRTQMAAALESPLMLWKKQLRG